jgi:hypothetical protein
MHKKAVETLPVLPDVSESDEIIVFSESPRRCLGIPRSDSELLLGLQQDRRVYI